MEGGEQEGGKEGGKGNPVQMGPSLGAPGLPCSTATCQFCLGIIHTCAPSPLLLGSREMRLISCRPIPFPGCEYKGLIRIIIMHNKN